jgi:ornithine cyclodeaminase/alanine dehydrogenase-like protein (mu-crystallin family)
MEDLQAEKGLENYEPNITTEQDIEDVKQALSLKQKYESKTLISKKTLQAERSKSEKGKLQSMVAEATDTYSKKHVPSAADNAVRLHNQLSTLLVNEVKSQMSNNTS